jgi:uncharacterized protein with PQ loop repeat
MDVPILAGMISTVVFAVSNLPMLRKALRTRDVSSYSMSSIVMINAANAVYSLYVFSLPIGPIWALHTFYLVSCGIMLVLCVRARRAAARRTRTSSGGDAEAVLADRVDLIGVDAGDPRTTRAHREPLDHRVDGGVVALDLGLDGTIGPVADPAGDAQSQGLELSGVAEAHALNRTVHDHSPADHASSVR